MVCTFIGHRSFNEKDGWKVKAVIKDLIVGKGVDRFYVGNHGSFDWSALVSLRELKKEFPHIKYNVVLAYFGKRFDTRLYTTEETMMFDGFEKVPLKFAISHRNNWMIDKADYVVTYIVYTHTMGAAQFAERAKKKNKICINTAELEF